MKVLVTGHDGYIGSVLAPLLATAGHTVAGLDTRLFAGCSLGPDLGTIESLVRDVRDVTPSDLEGFDAVVHLAALSNDPLGDLNEEWTYDINFHGTVQVASAARDAGVRRFVFASSCSMYGTSETDDLLDEESPLNPLTPYAASKVRAEEVLMGMANRDFAVVSMRNATVYGMSPRLRLDVVLNNLTAWAFTTGRVRLLSDGTSWRPLLHVRDLAAVTHALLDAPEDLIRGQAFNIGSESQNYRVRELAEVIAEVTGCEVEFAGDASPDPRSYRVDFGKLRRGFPTLEFAWDARRGAEDLASAFLQHGMSRDVFEGRRFVRLRQLRHLLDEGRLLADLRWADHGAVTTDVGVG